jgi:hypothetical protein
VRRCWTRLDRTRLYCPLPHAPRHSGSVYFCLKHHHAWRRWQSRVQGLQQLLDKRGARMDAEVVKRDYALLKAQKQLISVQVLSRSAKDANVHPPILVPMVQMYIHQFWCQWCKCTSNLGANGANVHSILLLRMRASSNCSTSSSPRVRGSRSCHLTR